MAAEIIFSTARSTTGRLRDVDSNAISFSQTFDSRRAEVVQQYFWKYHHLYVGGLRYSMDNFALDICCKGFFPEVILNLKVHSRHSDKEVLVLIHGMGSSPTAWKGIINPLLEAFTVITVDLPGHGDTKLDPNQEMDPEALAHSVIETLLAQGFNRFHVVGSSLGGWIAFEMATMKPDAILSITALAPAGLWLVPFQVRYPGTAVARMMASSLTLVSPVLLRYEWARKIGFSDVSPRWKEYSYELCLDATNAMAKAAGYYPAWDSLLKRRFGKPINESIPITIIFGDSDKTLPKETCQERSLAPAHAQWIIYENCGHAPMWDYPKKVVDEIYMTTKTQP